MFGYRVDVSTNPKAKGQEKLDSSCFACAVTENPSSTGVSSWWERGWCRSVSAVHVPIDSENNGRRLVPFSRPRDTFVWQTRPLYGDASSSHERCLCAPRGFVWCARSVVWTDRSVGAACLRPGWCCRHRLPRYLRGNRWWRTSEHQDRLPPLCLSARPVGPTVFLLASIG